MLRILIILASIIFFSTLTEGQELFLQTLQVQVLSPSFGNETLRITATVDALVLGSETASEDHKHLTIFKSAENSVIVAHRNSSPFYKHPSSSSNTVRLFNPNNLPTSSMTTYISTSNIENWIVQNNDNEVIEVKLSSSGSIVDERRIKSTFVESSTPNRILDTHYNAYEKQVSFETSDSVSYQNFCVNNSNLNKCCSDTADSSRTIAYSLQYNFSSPILCLNDVDNRQVETSLDFEVQVNARSSSASFVSETFSSSVTAVDENQQQNTSQTFSLSNDTTDETANTVTIKILQNSPSSTVTALLNSLDSSFKSTFDTNSRFCFYQFSPRHSSFLAPVSTTFGNERNKLGYFADTFAQQDKECNMPGVIYTAIYDSPPSLLINTSDQLAAIKDRYSIEKNLVRSLGISCDVVSFSTSSSSSGSLLQLDQVAFGCDEKRNLQLSVESNFVLGHRKLKRLFPVIEVVDAKAFIDVDTNNNNNKMTLPSPLYHQYQPIQQNITLNLSVCLDMLNIAGVTSPSGSLIFSIKSMNCDSGENSLKQHTISSSNFEVNSTLSYRCLSFHSHNVQVVSRPPVPVFGTRQFCLVGAKIDVEITSHQFEVAFKSTTNCSHFTQQKEMREERNNLLRTLSLQLSISGGAIVEANDLAGHVKSETAVTWTHIFQSFSVSDSGNAAEKYCDYIITATTDSSNNVCCDLRDMCPLQYGPGSTWIENSSSCSIPQLIPFRSSVSAIYLNDPIDVTAASNQQQLVLVSSLLPVGRSHHICTASQISSFSDKSTPSSCPVRIDTSNSNKELIPVGCNLPSHQEKLPLYNETEINEQIKDKTTQLLQINRSRLEALRDQLIFELLNQQEKELRARKSKHDAAAVFIAFDCILIFVIFLFLVLENSPRLQEILGLEDFFVRLHEKNDSKSRSTNPSSPYNSHPHPETNIRPSSSTSSPFSRSPSPTMRLEVGSPSPLRNETDSDKEDLWIVFKSLISDRCTRFSTWCSECWSDLAKMFSQLKRRLSKWYDEVNHQKKERSGNNSSNNILIQVIDADTKTHHRDHRRHSSSNKQHADRRSSSKPPTTATSNKVRHQSSSQHRKSHHQHPLFDLVVDNQNDGTDSVAETDLELLSINNQQYLPHNHQSRASSKRSISISSHLPNHIRREDSFAPTKFQQVPTNDHYHQKNQWDQHRNCETLRASSASGTSTTSKVKSVAAWSDFAPEMFYEQQQHQKHTRSSHHSHNHSSAASSSTNNNNLRQRRSPSIESNLYHLQPPRNRYVEQHQQQHQSAFYDDDDDGNYDDRSSAAATILFPPHHHQSAHGNHPYHQKKKTRSSSYSSSMLISLEPSLSSSSAKERNTRGRSSERRAKTQHQQQFEQMIEETDELNAADQFTSRSRRRKRSGKTKRSSSSNNTNNSGNDDSHQEFSVG